jgi:hypothetical protein
MLTSQTAISAGQRQWFESRWGYFQSCLFERGREKRGANTYPHPRTGNRSMSFGDVVAGATLPSVTCRMLVPELVSAASAVLGRRVAFPQVTHWPVG